MKSNTTINLFDLADYSDASVVKQEIRRIAPLITTEFDYDLLEDIYGDILKIFNGAYPGYRASSTRYHNIDHTNSVVLALIRLAHGLVVEGYTISARSLMLGLIGALFHDSGLIQTTDDLEGTGAKYTVGHEERSICLMSAQLKLKKFHPAAIDDCAQIIRCTTMKLSPSQISFSSQEIELMAKALSTADLLAQMADRFYLEKLPFLFMEFEEGGLQKFESPFDLFRKTESFYHSVVRKRLRNDLSGVDKLMQSHFRNYLGIDRDLYAEAISKNLEHLKILENDAGQGYQSLLLKLRRGGIIQKNMSQILKHENGCRTES